MSQPRVVLIGGGTGSFTLLHELKHWTKNISAIVNMCDDGGSTGVLRDELGVLPPGDIRQCLVALSNRPDARDLFNYRFSNGSFKGHTVGNIILSALELKTGSFAEAVKTVAEFMHITGEVIPVSLEKHTLEMKDGNKTIKGEYKISLHKIINRDSKVYLSPEAKLNPMAIRAIAEADLVVIAPGNLYCSLLPSLSVEGITKALKNTKAKVVMVANLINKPAQTKDWHVADYLNELNRYIGQDTIDLVLYNTKLPGKELLKKYAEDGELPLRIDPEGFKTINIDCIGAPLVANNTFKQDPADKTIKRTLIRHDAKEVVNQLKKLIMLDT